MKGLPIADGKMALFRLSNPARRELQISNSKSQIGKRQSAIGNRKSSITE